MTSSLMVSCVSSEMVSKHSPRDKYLNAAIIFMKKGATGRPNELTLPSFVSHPSATKRSMNFSNTRTGTRKRSNHRSYSGVPGSRVLLALNSFHHNVSWKGMGASARGPRGRRFAMSWKVVRANS
jgi:hypothetical protein